LLPGYNYFLQIAISYKLEKAHWRNEFAAGYASSGASSRVLPYLFFEKNKYIKI